MPPSRPTPLRVLTSLALLLLTTAVGCSSSSTPAADAGVDATRTDLAVDGGGGAPTPAFERFCGTRQWEQTLTSATLGKLTGTYAGKIEGLAADRPFKAGTLESMKVVATHPFRVEKIRVAFAGGSGKARIRLMKAYGRSYPGAWGNLKDTTTYDLVPPIEIDVSAPDPEKWIELDVAAAGAYLLPTEHYSIVYEHLARGPFLALESVPVGELGRALIIDLPDLSAYAVGDGTQSFNYRMELAGSTFCAWSDGERWLGEDTTQPFASSASAFVSLVDLDGDGHDDVVGFGSRVVDAKSGREEPVPVAWLADGKGGFAEPPFAVFPPLRAVSVVAFADVDNDGDVDAIAFGNVSTDADGDGYTIDGAPPDCDDTNPLVHPGAQEIDGNGIDDDCDGVIDQGKDTSDRDKDGFSVADGDCDDTRNDVYPGALELPDGRDNDCNGQVDEVFANRFLRNDGKGQLVVVPGSGIETLDPTTVAAFGDADGDGKLDIYWGNWLQKYPEDRAASDRFFRGNGDGTFVDAQASAGLVLPTAYSPYGLRWNDYDGDGDQDLFVSNYHLYPNQLWRNDGKGHFIDVAPLVGVDHDDQPPSSAMIKAGLTGGHSYGVAFGDLDNDGDMDLFVTNLAHPRTQPWGDRSVFYVNSGAPDYTFTPATEKLGFIYDEGDVAVAFGDIDNDGDLDVAIASLYEGHYSRVYRNDGAAGFVDISYETGAAVHDAVGVAFCDVDGDGKLDLLISDRDAKRPNLHLLLNRPSAADASNAWVELLLEGTGQSNRQALGARVRITAGGVTRLREVEGSNGSTQPSRWLHFGLGAVTALDKVEIRWPDGTVEAVSGVEPRKRHRVKQGDGAAKPF